MQARTLPNGLRVVVDPSHTAKVAAVQVWVRVGSADERAEEAGLAHVHEHMLFKGTERRQLGEIAQAIEGAGGDINAYTSFDQTVYHVTIASREVSVALDILSDAVQHSAFEADELARELEVVLEELRRGKDSPQRVNSELLFSTAFREHNYGRPVIGYVETVERFTRDGILDFYRRWYRPQNMLLVVAGDVEPEAIFEQAGTLFKQAKLGPPPERPRTPEPPQEELRFAQARMDIAETHLSLAWHGPQLSHEDTAAVDVLTVLLGTGESSRLYRRVRRDAELVTDCYAYAYTPQEPGLIGVGAQIQDRPVRDALALILKETLRLRYEAPLESEVEKAKTIVLSEAVYSMQTVQGRARRLGYFEQVAGGVDFEARYRAAVAKVTPDAVLQAAERWLHPEAFTVSMVQPEGTQEEIDESVVRATLEAARRDLEDSYRVPRIESLDLGVAHAVLSNGAKVYVEPDPSVPLVSILAVAPGGLLAESSASAGVSHLVGELIVRGTERYSAEEIIERCDAMAGGVGGQSGRNSLGLRGEFLKESWGVGLDIFSSCLLEPTFADTEVERERRTALEDLASRQDHPGSVAMDTFARGLYGDEHPYGWSVLGTQASLENLTREGIVDAYRSQLRPDRLTLSVVGDVDVNDTVARLERTIGSARPHPEAAPLPTPPAFSEPMEPVSFEVHRDKEQVQLIFGFLGLKLDDERRHALEVMTQILGGQSGRLFMELRDRQSLAYSVGGFSLEGLERGYLALHIGTHPDKLTVAEAGMRRELERLMEELPSPEEMQRAQRYLVGAHEIGFQRGAARASTMALNAAYGLGYDAHVRYADSVTAVSPDAVRDIARELVRFDRVVRAVVGPVNVPRSAAG